MRPSEACQQHKEIIRQIVGRNHATNPRVFGSALHGEDTEDRMRKSWSVPISFVPISLLFLEALTKAQSAADMLFGVIAAVEREAVARGLVAAK